MTQRTNQVERAQPDMEPGFCVCFSKYVGWIKKLSLLAWADTYGLYVAQIIWKDVRR